MRFLATLIFLIRHSNYLIILLFCEICFGQMASINNSFSEIWFKCTQILYPLNFFSLLYSITSYVHKILIPSYGLTRATRFMDSRYFNELTPNSCIGQLEFYFWSQLIPGYQADSLRPF
jgi:hypothetical protein